MFRASKDILEFSSQITYKHVIEYSSEIILEDVLLIFTRNNI